MRWIDMRGFQPSAKWLADAEAKTDALRQMDDEERRLALTASSASRLWGLLRDGLSPLGDGKCWYTEAAFGAGDAQVEHYRPKLGFDGAGEEAHDGYWWLAFAYSNYRLIASIPNRTKSSAFPISGPRATGEGQNLDDELPVLLDPTRPHDVSLLTFADGGVPKPAPHADPLEVTRVEYTITRCGLTGGHVAREREKVWNDCANAYREWTIERVQAGVSASARAKANALLERMLMMRSPASPYSQTAQACFEQRRGVGLFPVAGAAVADPT